MGWGCERVCVCGGGGGGGTMATMSFTRPTLIGRPASSSPFIDASAFRASSARRYLRHRPHRSPASLRRIHTGQMRAGPVSVGMCSDACSKWAVLDEAEALGLVRRRVAVDVDVRDLSKRREHLPEAMVFLISIIIITTCRKQWHSLLI